MEQTMDWSDLRLFLAIARCGGLRAASAELNVSVATLSRRMTSFEQSLGRKLFVRGAQGYALTEEGAELRAVSADAAQGMATVARWVDHRDFVNQVRISAGDWTMLLLLRHLHQFIDPADRWSPEFVASNARLDIARRQIDVGIRNARPTEAWLAAQQFGHVDYAVYAAEDAPEDIPWIGSCLDDLTHPASRWVEEHHSKAVGIRLSSPHLGLPLAQAGAGKMVMTRFIGDATPGLHVLGESIPELRSEQWLVMHQDERNYPPVRAALKAVGQVLEGHSQTNL